MRLTLRTLLAYMDDVLESTDHEDLGKKIESSDFATELIHRSRDAVRRLRLGAPDVLVEDSDDVLDAGNTADANVVAEYLDNTLSTEKVADFERLCLETNVEADMYLAEVASCHHVLTMVLGEPAEIDVAVRQRMYELPTKLSSGKQPRVDPSHVPSVQQSPPPQTTPATTAPPVQHREPDEPDETELPDYLRAAANARRRVKRWVLAATLLLVVGGIVGYFVLGEFKEVQLPPDLAQDDLLSIEEGLTIEGGNNSPAADGGSAVEPTTEAPRFKSADSMAASDAPPFDAAKLGEAPAFTSSAKPTDSEDSQAPAFVAPVPSKDVATTAEKETAPATTDSTTDVDSPLDLEMLGSASETTGADAEAKANAAGPDPLSMPLTATIPGDELATPADDAAKASSDRPDRKPSGAADAAADANAKQPTSEAHGPARLGSYLGNNDVLLRYDNTSGKWIRLPPRSPISWGERLLVLPKFRSQISLADVNVHLSGGTQLEIPARASRTDDGADLDLKVVYGRLLLVAGLHGNRVSFQIGDEVRQVQLDNSANLAVEAHRVFVPGSDYEREPSPIEAVWYLTTGSVDWPGTAGGSQTIQAPATWRTNNNGIDAAPQPMEQLPDWIDREPMTDLERRARDTLAEELQPGQPVGIRLLELNNDPRGPGRRREVRTLAAESSVYVGEFEPFVKALNDVDQSRAWDSQIRTLREALALSPDVATRVREAFVNLRGEEAAKDLMKMVRGYNQKDIGTTREAVMKGALVKLIGWLDNDSLDYRVLAIHNLNEITGTSYLGGYRPTQSASQRQRALRKIRDRLESNELLPKP